MSDRLRQMKQHALAQKLVIARMHLRLVKISRCYSSITVLDCMQRVGSDGVTELCNLIERFNAVSSTEHCVRADVDLPSGSIVFRPCLQANTATIDLSNASILLRKIAGLDSDAIKKLRRIAE